MSEVYKFSEFVIDKQTLTLYCQNLPVRISSKAFQILTYLIENSGKVVEKDDILDQVWKDCFVEEANLAVQVSALRRILREKKGQTRFIKTIPGRGYSFIGSVEEIENISAIKKDFKTIASAEQKKKSIAVLPFTFENGSEEHEYLANGVTHSLIADLSKIHGVRVLAYSAVKPYKNSAMDLQEIGFLLNVNELLTGVISEFKGRWEITAELIDTTDKSCLWTFTQSFEESDIFEVKKDISSKIVEKLKIRTGIISHTEIDSQSQKLYYRGKYLLESRLNSKNYEAILYQALKFFNDALEREPSFALAYSGLVSVYCLLHNHNLLNTKKAFFEANKALKMALVTGSDVSDVYIVKGMVEIFFSHNLSEAGESFTKAIELNANNSDGYYWKSIVYRCLGDFEKATELAEKLLEQDHISILFQENLVRILYFSRRYEEAIAVADELLEFDTNSPTPYLFKALCFNYLGLFDSALEAIEKTIKVRNTPETFLYKAYILAYFDKKNDALEIVRRVVREYSETSIDNYDLAGIYSVLNEKEKAFDYLNRALESQSAELCNTKYERRFENITDDPRFTKFLSKINLT